MMFVFHSAMMLALIAISLGVMLIVWAARNEGKGIVLANFFGWLITVIAILAIICSSYYSIAYWYHGYFKSPMGMHMMMQSKPMPDGMGDMHNGMEPAQ